METPHRRIGEILKRRCLLTDQQLDDAAILANTRGQRIGQALIDLGLVRDTDVVAAMATQYGVEHIDLDKVDIVTRENLKLLPIHIIRKYRMLPLTMRNDRLVVVVHEPLDKDAIEFLRDLSVEIIIVLTTQRNLDEQINRIESVLADPPTVLPWRMDPEAATASYHRYMRGWAEAVKELHCPACGMAFTDFAINWSEAWSAGYHHERNILDGPTQLKCERCGKCSWLGPFGGLELADHPFE